MAVVLLGSGSARASRVLVLQPSVNGTTVSGAPARACAGGILDSVHEAQVQLTATNPDGTPLPGLVLNLSWTGNQGHNYGNGQPLKRAHFLDANGNIMNDANGVPLDEISVTTDGNGNAPLNVVSGDVVCTPDVVIDWNGNNVGVVTFDFGEDESLRRFGLVNYFGEVDDGCLFNQGAALLGPGQTNQVQIYLKFQANTSIPTDMNYFLVHGVPSPTLDPDGRGQARTQLDDWQNWEPVAGHILTVVISNVLRVDGTAVSPEDFSGYASLEYSQGNPTQAATVTTAADGTVQVRLLSGSMIGQCSEIDFTSTDEMQYSY
jgi:hypothetical protein